MIQTFTFQCPIGETSQDRLLERLRTIVKSLVKFQHVLRGFTAEIQAVEQPMVVIRLRVAGANRWNIAADAKRLAALILRRALLNWKQASLVTLVTEPNGRDLLLGQGRTPRVRVPRADRKPDGSQWEHIAWWGDDLG